LGFRVYTLEIRRKQRLDLSPHVFVAGQLQVIPVSKKSLKKIKKSCKSYLQGGGGRGARRRCCVIMPHAPMCDYI
jgi:hypothetical protein